ncbi:MAG: SIMPL domain-containing protein [Campylobacteraceae bacterium]
MKQPILKYATILFLALSVANAAPNTQEDSVIELSKLKYGNDKLAVGNINVEVTQNIKLVPDTAQFSITYITQDATPNEASNRNIENMKKLKDYLLSLGVKESDLTTINYNNYQSKVSTQVVDANKKFSTLLKVRFVSLKDNFYGVINALEKNGVSNVKQDNTSTGYYTFNISEFGSSKDATKTSAQNKYTKIEDELKKLGANNIEIFGYETKESIGENSYKNQYFVTNTISIKVKNFDNLGKIITKAQELKMTINSDMAYSISDEKKSEIIAKEESLMFKKLQEKAQRLIKESNYKIGVPSYLNIYLNENYTDSVLANRFSGITNTAKLQSFEAKEVDINTPNEFMATILMNGSFELVQDIVK